jgi:hypothetical protein
VRRFLLPVLLCCLSLSAQALELGGVVVSDSAHLGRSNLLLNGAGVRSKFVFDLYVASLYLSAKKNSAAEVITDEGEKRISLQILREINAEDLVSSLDKAIVRNQTDEELAAIKVEQHEFRSIFSKLVHVKKGDSILLDYLPATGTQVSVNGAPQGSIPGAAFYTALLKIWLGEKPADETLKLKLLGGK